MLFLDRLIDILKRLVFQMLEKIGIWIRKGENKFFQENTLLSRLYWRCKILIVRITVRLGVNHRTISSSPLIEQYGYEPIRKLYNIERKFRKLIEAAESPQKRAELYTEVYDELYNLYGKYVGFDPELITKYKAWFKNMVVIDFGCGLGRSTELLSKYAKVVYGIEASRVCCESAKSKYENLENVGFRLSSDCLLPFDDRSIDCVYSSDILEHLHPDDLLTHLREVYRVLKTRGHYLFFTPGSRSGPHDSTKAFYPQGKGFKSTGLHIKEYTFGELTEILREVGYKSVSIPDLHKEIFMICEK